MISKIEDQKNNENEINLKTNLNDSLSVYEKIRKNVKFSNFNEIFNGNEKKKFSYSSKTGFHRMLSTKSNKKNNNNNNNSKNSFVTEINQKSFGNKTGEGNLSVPINKNKLMENLNVFIENFYEYFEKIRSFYPIFKKNHSNFNININDNNNNNKIEYVSNFNKLKKFINENKKDFIDSKEFKLDKKLLEMNLKEISNKIIPIQDEKIQIIEEEKKYCLNYFKNVFNFINENLYLNIEINNLIIIINKNKIHMKNIRKNYMKNSAEILLKKNKKQNLLKIKNYLLNIHNITKNINNIFECEINEEKNIIKNIQKNFIEFKKKNNFNNNNKKTKIKFLYQIEKDILKFSQEFEVKYINTFIKKLYEILISCFNFVNIKSIFNKNNLTSKFNSNTIYELNDEYLFKNIKNYSYQNYKIFNLSNNEKLQDEINILMNLYNIILFNSYDFNLLIDKIKNLICFIISEIQDIKINNNNNNDENNYIYILIVINSYYYLYINFNFIIDCITNNFGTSKKTFNEINNDSIINKCENILLNLIEDYINIELIKNNNFEIYFNIEGSLLNELNKFGKILNKNYNNLFENNKKNFIVNFFNKKIEEINNFIQKDNFTKILNFNVKYQKIVNVLLTEINKLKFENFKEIINSKEIMLIHYINIDNYSYKISESFLEMLNIIFHVYQILFLIINNKEKNNNNNNLIFIFRQLSQIINNYITYCDNIIIEKEKNEKKSFENEFIILNSHINILYKILNKEFIKIDKSNTLKILDSLKVNHLQYNLEIKNSLNTILIRLIDNFDKLNFNKYPIKNNNNFNDYIESFKKIFEIYKQMLNAFNKEDIKNIIEGIFNKLFNLFEDSVYKKEKFNDIYMFTQFKNEMEFLEKLFNDENNFLTNENEIIIDGKKYVEKIKNFIEITKPKNNNINTNNNIINKKENDILHSIKEVNEDDIKNINIDDINLDDEINFRKMEKKTLAYKIGRNKHNHKKHKEIPVVEILDDDDNNNIPVFKRNENSNSMHNKSESSYGDTTIVNRNNNYVLYDIYE